MTDRTFGLNSIPRKTFLAITAIVVLCVLPAFAHAAVCGASVPALMHVRVFASAAGLGVTPALAAAETYPSPIGFVNDFANVIPDEDEAAIRAIATELEEKTGAELAVATFETTGGVDIQDYSVGLYTRWGIGKRGKDNGVLIVAAIQDRQLWIKPGYGLEGTITDAFSHAIYRDVLRPAFRKGEYGRGLLSAVEIIATAVADSEGVTLSTIGQRKVLPERSTEGGSGVVGPAVFLAILFLVLILMAVARTSSGRRVSRSPFWTIGRFSGGLKGGGFGGGFGGFGGGSCGGGGAGGGW